MSAPMINTELRDLSIEEQEILSGGKKQGKKGTIRVDDAVFKYGGEEYPARIFVTVKGLPSTESQDGGGEDGGGEDGGGEE